MFDDDRSLYVVFGLLIVFVIGHITVQRRESIKLTLQYRLYFYGLVMIILWFQLPSMPSLALLGHHGEINALANNERLLNYLQHCNDAMDDIKHVVHFMIFITVFWLVSIVSSIIKHFKLEKTSE